MLLCFFVGCPGTHMANARAMLTPKPTEAITMPRTGYNPFEPTPTSSIVRTNPTGPAYPKGAGK